MDDLTEALHASAPAGYKCADCQIDGEPCPTCYRAWWMGKHPNVTLIDEAERGRRMVKACISHVDGRDLLAELQPKQWHFCNIRVRINGQWKEYEGDWLKRLMAARDG